MGGFGLFGGGGGFGLGGGVGGNNLSSLDP